MNAITEIPRDKLTGSLRRSAVKKNVAAIHVSGKLTLLQRKLSNVLLLNAYDDLLSKPAHRIDARALSVMIGYNSNDMATLRASLRGLAETVAEWDMLDERGRREWGVSALLSYAKLREGVCEYAYSPALAEKLHDPKVFALINLNIQRRFTSGHALALYENCYRFVRTGSTGWWPIELFRRLMGVDGSSYYETFKHLNAKVIKPAVTEINRTSNIIVAPEFRRRGRAVEEIRFRIRENPQLAMFEIDDAEGVRDSGVYARLIGLGVGDRLARQWIAEHGEAHVAEKLSHVEAHDGVASPLRYLSAAFRDDHATGGPSAATAGSVPGAGAEVGAGQGGALPGGQTGTRPGGQAVTPPGVRTGAPPAGQGGDPSAGAPRHAAAGEAVSPEARAGQGWGAEDEAERERRLRVARLRRVRETAAARSPTQRDADRKLFAASLHDPLDAAHFREHGWGSGLNARAILRFWEELEPGIFDESDGEDGPPA